MGEAARAVMEKVPELEPEPDTPKAPILPVAPLKPLTPIEPLKPLKPTKREKTPEPIKPRRKEDSPRLQGSKIYIPLMKRKEARKVLWDEWIRAGIGKLRGQAGAVGGRGPVLNEEELEYLPEAKVIVPGRDGSLLVPTEIMLDEDEFDAFLDQWGIGDRISIEVEGMYRAEGPVAKGVYIAQPQPDDGDE
jgi:hypothetical protein